MGGAWTSTPRASLEEMPLRRVCEVLARARPWSDDPRDFSKVSAQLSAEREILVDNFEGHSGEAFIAPSPAPDLPPLVVVGCLLLRLFRGSAPCARQGILECLRPRWECRLIFW